MNKFSVMVPYGIKFISEWKEFSLPDFPHIMNKQVTGCGFTEYFLRPNPKYPKVILVSPRRVLLENKEEQHNRPKGNTAEEIELRKKDLGSVYYARNDIENETGYDIDMISVGKKAIKEDITLIPEDELKARISNFKCGVQNYIANCSWPGAEKDIRIVVTYDSFRLIREILGQSIYDYQIVVDEFQSLLLDSVFKSDTELELLSQLRDLSKVCFLSATPMLDKYLEKLSSFKDLPYYELDWESLQPGRTSKPNLECKQCASIVTEAEKEINRYLQGDFERYSWRDKFGNIQEKYSTELVIYCNSVKNICDIIKKCKLKPNQFNILCAKTEENRKKINQAIKIVDPSVPIRMKNYIGTIPQEGDPHKMFTFCTRTVYLGADFYSTCARTLILSDANIQCLTVDISMDLIQILGRQRLVNVNPWATSAMFRYKTNTNKINESEFSSYLEGKIKTTKDLLSIWSKGTTSEQYNLAEVYKSTARNEKYKNNYVAVNNHAGSTPLPCFNELVLVAEQRAFDIQQIDYRDRFTIITEIETKCEVNNGIQSFLQSFESISLGKMKMKYLCEFLQKNPELSDEVLMSIPMTYRNYYTVLGPSRCYAFSYQMSKLEEEYQKQFNNQKVPVDNFENLMSSSFKEGKRYTNVDIKNTLQGIYDRVGLKKVAKASDLEEWFMIKKCLIPENKKRLNGLEIIKKK